MAFRHRKVSELIKHELGNVITEYVKELEGLVTITTVNLSNDYSHANVHVSCFKTERKKEDVIKVLNKNAKMLKRLISPRLHMKKIPNLHFELDDSGDYMEHLDELFYTIRKERSNTE